VKPTEGSMINIKAWMAEDPNHSFEAWRSKLPKIPPEPPKPSSKEKKELNTSSGAGAAAYHHHPKKKVSKKENSSAEKRQHFLMRKYSRLWKEKLKLPLKNISLRFDEAEIVWVKKLLFCPGSVQTRLLTAALLKDIAQYPHRRLMVRYIADGFLENVLLFGNQTFEIFG